MSNKVKDIDIKNCTYYFFIGIIHIKKFDRNIIKIDEKSYQKYSYILYWICDDQRFEIRKNLQCNSFALYF